MSDADIGAFGFRADEFIGMTTAMDGDLVRVARGFRIAPYNVPAGCIGAFFPEVRLPRPAITEQAQPEVMGR